MQRLTLRFRFYLKKLGLSFAQAYYLQLIMTLASLPLLVWWGLPLSIFSIAGNMFFGPFLAAFLALSSLLFFTELLHIPNAAGAWLLEVITKLWAVPLAWGNQTILIGAVPPHGAVLCAITLFLLFFIVRVAQKSLLYRCVSATVLLFCLFIFFKVVQKTASVKNSVQLEYGEIIVAHDNGKLCCVDKGGISKRVLKSKSVEYNLRPLFIKATGCTQLSFLVLAQPTQQALKNATLILEHFEVETIYLPSIENDPGIQWKKAYRRLRFKADEKNTTLKRYYTDTPRILYKKNGLCLEVKPDKTVSLEAYNKDQTKITAMNVHQKDFLLAQSSA